MQLLASPTGSLSRTSVFARPALRRAAVPTSGPEDSRKMPQFFERASTLLREAPVMIWGWFNALNTEEWFVVLGITAVAGFLCMRGMGSRRGV